MISRDECEHPSSDAEGRHCGLCSADVIDVANEARLRVQMETITGQAAMMDAMRANMRAAQEALEDARPALKWVVNHAHRNNDHDMSHAQLALDHVLRALDRLRGGDGRDAFHRG